MESQQFFSSANVRWRNTSSTASYTSEVLLFLLFDIHGQRKTFNTGAKGNEKTHCIINLYWFCPISLDLSFLKPFTAYTVLKGISSTNHTITVSVKTHDHPSDLNLLMRHTGNTDSTEIQAGHHFQPHIPPCCTSRSHSQRHAAMRKIQHQKWLFYGVTLSDFLWQILEYNTAARQEGGKVIPICRQCDGINSVRSSPHPWVDFSTLFLLSFAHFCRWKQFFTAQVSEQWHRLPVGYGDSPLEISKSCLDVGLGALLWASLLGQGLEQVDIEVPPCNFRLHVNPWREPLGEKATLFFLFYLFPKYCLIYKFPYIRKQTYTKISLCLMRHLNTAFLLRSWEVPTSFPVLKSPPIICAKNLVLSSSF